MTMEDVQSVNIHGNDQTEEPTILDVYKQMIERHAQEADEFLNNKYASRRQNTNNLFPDDSAFLTFSFINNEIALDQYIKEQRTRHKGIMRGKLKVNYNQEFSNTYIPGKRLTNFPTTSCLARNQMTAAYHHYMSHKTHNESFASQILEEIEEFQAYAQQMWRNVNYQRAVELDQNVKSIIDNYWQSKICEGKSLYPSVYRNVSTVPLTLDTEESKQIHLTHVSNLHTEGIYHQISNTIKLKREHLLTTDSKDMTAWLRYEQKDTSSEDVTNNLDQDETAESLAVMNNCQVAMTTSSVKTLLNNHAENHYATSWMLPVHIKLIVDPNTGLEKKIIFINKKLTHKTLTTAQKLFWFTKLAVKKFCFDYSNQQESEERAVHTQRGGDEIDERNGISRDEETVLSRNKKRKKRKNKRNGKRPADGAEVAGTEGNENDVTNNESEAQNESVESEKSLNSLRNNVNSRNASLTSDLLEERQGFVSQDGNLSPEKVTNAHCDKEEVLSSNAQERVKRKRGGVSSDDDDSEEDGGLCIDIPEDVLSLKDQPMELDEGSTVSPETSHSENPLLVEETATAQNSKLNCDQLQATSKLNPSHLDLKDKQVGSQPRPESKPRYSLPKAQTRLPEPLQPVDYSCLSSNGRNRIYSLWKLFKEYTQGSELLKNTRHPLNIMIRSRQDGKKSHPEQREYVCIRPKVEYQCEYGAEISSLHELLDEWASLYLRPNADLLRVRVAHDNLEVTMTEPRSCVDLSHQIQQQYRLNPRYTLGNLYSVLWYLMELAPGRYLLSHEPKSNAFVNVYRADPKGSHLPMAGWQCTEGIGRATWRPIDPSVVTPSHTSTKTLPALFPPSSQVIAIKRNAKKQKNATYVKHLAQLKKQAQADNKKKKREKQKSAQKKKAKATNETAVKQGDAVDLDQPE